MKFLKNNLAYISLWSLSLVPVAVWLFMMPLSERLASAGGVFRSLGQVTGLLGMALLSLNFILAARYKFLDKWFAGLNRVYMKHHMVGIIAFCLLLFHPIFLIIQYLTISLPAAFNFILPGNFYLDLGKVALVIFIVLMVFTLYLKLKYQNWKISHKFLGLVLIISIFHMLYVPSDVSNNAALRYYMILLAILGIISYLYRTIFGVYKKEEYKYRLKEVKKINDNIVELILSPMAGKINFMPGQFVFLKFVLPDAGSRSAVLSESHPFSITSSPGSGDLSLGIKTLGDYTSMIYLSKPGLICSIEGPFGAFSYVRSQSKRQIWIAGGIGITPFLSMARHYSRSKDKNDYKIDLYYSVKNDSESAFAEELALIAKQNNNFRFYQHCSQRDGYISAKFVVNNSEDAMDAEIFLCGPQSFMQSLRSQFTDLGFANSKIHSEEFSL